MTPEEIEQQAKTYAENIWPYIECENKHVEGEANHGIRMSREDAFTDFKAGAEAANKEMKEKIEGLILKWEKLKEKDLKEVEDFEERRMEGAADCRFIEMKQKETFLTELKDLLP